MTNSYSFGIEEEYFLSNGTTRDACRTTPKHFMDACSAAFPDVFEPEFLQSQVEVQTPPCTSANDARAYLSAYRAGLGRIARDHDLRLFASGTHPLANWSKQRQTEDRRYDKVMHELQMIGARNMVCGLHAHVEVSDPDKRVDLMVRALPFVPLILALSTSSPFWQARRTGLMGYRLAAYDELPRTGLPDLFESTADYERFINTLVEARVIADSSYIWWVIRPSLKHPTLELRAADSCTRVEDAVNLALLFRAIVRHLDCNPTVNAGMTAASRAIIAENKWRAQRYGIHGSFIDEKKRQLVGVSDLLETTLTMLAEDLDALNCTNEVASLRDILSIGTSADQQIAIFTEARGRGRNQSESLMDVVDWLTIETEGRSILQ